MPDLPASSDAHGLDGAVAVDARLRDLERARDAQPCRETIDALDAARRRAGDGPYLPVRCSDWDRWRGRGQPFLQLWRAWMRRYAPGLDFEAVWRDWVTPAPPGWHLLEPRVEGEGDPVQLAQPRATTYGVRAGDLVYMGPDGRVRPIYATDASQIPAAPSFLGVAVRATPDANGTVTIRLGRASAADTTPNEGRGVVNRPTRKRRRRRR